VNDVRTKAESSTLTRVTVRAAASWFLDQKTLPRHGTVQGFEKDFRATLGELLPLVEELAAGQPDDDVPAKVALAALAEARHRLGAAEAPGLQGEVKRVKLLAASVLAACDHYDVLTGLRMCLLCDKPLEDAWEPFERGGPAQPGRVHITCADTVRR